MINQTKTNLRRMMNLRRLIKRILFKKTMEVSSAGSKTNLLPINQRISMKVNLASSATLLKPKPL